MGWPHLWVGRVIRTRILAATVLVASGLAVFAEGPVYLGPPPAGSATRPADPPGTQPGTTTRLLSEIKEANLTVRTKFGLVDFASDSVQEVAFDANQAGAVSLQAWGGNAVRGTLANATVDFEVAPSGPRFKAPAGQIVSITCPFALPAGARKEVARLVALLGAGSFKDREAASRALVKMGKDILPLLKKYLADDDPEVRQRVQEDIDQISPDAPQTHAPSP